jgi:hypothetical protein
MDAATVAADPRAARLLGLWSRLSAQHVTLGSGCGCGVGGVSVSLQDFELDIADYLWAESERLGVQSVEAFLLQPGPIAEQVHHRLARTLDSFAKLHGPMGTPA